MIKIARGTSHQTHPLTCCSRLVLIDPTQPELDSSWRELRSRHMDWAPNMDQTTREWQAEWVCLRCNNHVTGAHHHSIQYEGTRPTCSIHGPRQLAVDYRSRERGWICSTEYPLQFHDCQPTLLHEPTRTDAPTTAMPPVANGPWTRQGPPPQHQNTPATHFWFYVPPLFGRGPQAPPRHRDAMGTATRRGRMDTPHQPTPGRTARAMATPYHHHHNPTPERQ